MTCKYAKGVKKANEQKLKMKKRHKKKNGSKKKHKKSQKYTFPNSMQSLPLSGKSHST